jgi:hypothetical protein
MFCSQTDGFHCNFKFFAASSGELTQERLKFKNLIYKMLSINIKQLLLFAVFVKDFLRPYIRHIKYQELVRFDLQKMENPEISGIEYQQGELQGY